MGLVLLTQGRKEPFYSVGDSLSAFDRLKDYLREVLNLPTIAYPATIKLTAGSLSKELVLSPKYWNTAATNVINMIDPHFTAADQELLIFAPLHVNGLFTPDARDGAPVELHLINDLLIGEPKDVFVGEDENVTIDGSPISKGGHFIEALHIRSKYDVEEVALTNEERNSFPNLTRRLMDFGESKFTSGTPNVLEFHGGSNFQYFCQSGYKWHAKNNCTVKSPNGSFSIPDAIIYHFGVDAVPDASWKVSAPVNQPVIPVDDKPVTNPLHQVVYLQLKDVDTHVTYPLNAISCAANVFDGAALNACDWIKIMKWMILAEGNSLADQCHDIGGGFVRLPPWIKTLKNTTGFYAEVNVRRVGDTLVATELEDPANLYIGCSDKLITNFFSNLSVDDDKLYYNGVSHLMIRGPSVSAVVKNAYTMAVQAAYVNVLGRKISGVSTFGDEIRFLSRLLGQIKDDSITPYSDNSPFNVSFEEKCNLNEAGMEVTDVGKVFGLVQGLNRKDSFSVSDNVLTLVKVEDVGEGAKAFSLIYDPSYNNPVMYNVIPSAEEYSQRLVGMYIGTVINGAVAVGIDTTKALISEPVVEGDKNGE